MTMSAPRSRTNCAFALPAVVATVAPRCLASWIATDPTPPAPPWMSTFWPASHPTPLDQRLPGGQRDQRQRRRGLDVDRDGGDREVGLRHGDALGERADVIVVRAAVDRVARLETPHVGADADHGSREIVAEHEREGVRQDLPELAEPDLLVEDVDPGGTHAHEDVGAPDTRFGRIDLLERALNAETA